MYPFYYEQNALFFILWSVPSVIYLLNAQVVEWELQYCQRNGWNRYQIIPVGFIYIQNGLIQPLSR